MLLTENPSLKIKINDLNINFNFNFNTIQNLYYGLKDEVICKRLKIKTITPLELLEVLELEFNKGYLILLIHSSMNGNIELDEIITNLESFNVETLEKIQYMIKSIMIQSLIYIEKTKKEEKEEKKSEKEEEDSPEEVFENWFNYYYVMAIDKLKIPFKGFLKSTPAQIKERVNRVNIDLKNTYNAYPVTVGQGKEDNVEEVSDIREFFSRI